MSRQGRPECDTAQGYATSENGDEVHANKGQRFTCVYSQKDRMLALEPETREIAGS